MGKRKKRVAELTSSGTDDVFKVKHKSLKKSKPTTVKNAKSVGLDTCQHVIMRLVLLQRQALRHGQDLLDDQFVHLHHQQQLQSANTFHVAKVIVVM